MHGINNMALIGQEKADLPTALLRELDAGEASVIYTATRNGIDTVAIDEKSGRRVARKRSMII